MPAPAAFSDDAELDAHYDLLERARRLPPMSPLQRRAQQISFVVGNILIDRPYSEAYEYELLRHAAETWDRAHGEVRERP